MPLRNLVTYLSAAIAPVLATSPARAQICAKTFGPMEIEFHPSQGTAADQVSPAVARGLTGWTVAWTESQDIYARRIGFDLTPLGGQFLVDSTYNLGIQDQPAISHDATGNFMIAWTDHNGYDGSGTGIYGRVYDPSGVPLGLREFKLSSVTSGPQWRPMLAPTPAGGWVVAWSGDPDGNAYIRILDSTGAFLTGDIRVNTYVPGGQFDTDVAVNPSGTIFVAFVDGSRHGNVGTGTNLYGRAFDSTGAALQNREFALTTFTSDGDQRAPYVAADGLGRFVVSWDDETFDGSGYGIYARLFGPGGDPLAPEFQVNTTTAGDQRSSAIAEDQLGRFLVTWQDYSGGFANPKIRARRYNGQANPLASDFVVNENPSIGVLHPVLAMDTSGSDILFAYEGPGAPGDGHDVYARTFAASTGPQIYCTAKVNSLGCSPAIAYSGDPSVSGSNPFTITSSEVLNQKLGLLIYGYSSSFSPFQGVTICVSPPLKRLRPQSSGGNTGPLDCSGALTTDFNARIRSGIDPGLVSGATVSARWYYRDPGDPAGFFTGLSNAIRFAICP